MKTFTIEDIRSWKPCYDPSRHLPEGWSGPALDILKHETIPAQDKLWVVARESLISAKTLRLYAVWCARQVQHLMKDSRSIAALDVAERYANGSASDEDLAAARDAAWAAAWAARDAAWDTRDAARAAALATAWDARAAAWAAWAAARDAARDAAWAAQIKKLVEMIEQDEAINETKI